MNEETEKFYNFLIDNGYIDPKLGIKSIDIKLNIDERPSIKVEYDLKENLYLGGK